jgi:hypothetical protein
MHNPRRLLNPAPIIESLRGNLEFLMGTGYPNDPPLVASRAEPFPDAASIQTVLRAKRADPNPRERYGLGRVANNLAAVHICTGNLPAAFEAIQEAEQAFTGMLNEGDIHPWQLTRMGLAMVLYNGAVMFHVADDTDGQFECVQNRDTQLERAEHIRRSALESLDLVEEPHRDEDYRFLHGALVALPSPS